MPINNHTEANRGKIEGHIPLEHMFGFCKSFKKITKNLGFHLTCKANDIQKVLYTTIANDINVTIITLHLFVLVLIPNTETEVMFNESIKNNYKITYDSWYSERKLSTDGNELQVDFGSVQQVNSPKYLVGAFQTADRIAANKKPNDIAIFDNVNVEKYFAEIDGCRYPEDAFSQIFLRMIIEINIET